MDRPVTTVVLRDVARPLHGLNRWDDGRLETIMDVERFDGGEAAA
jgi:hypothetical protein